MRGSFPGCNGKFDENVYVLCRHFLGNGRPDPTKVKVFRPPGGQSGFGMETAPSCLFLIAFAISLS
jgi:hypothetical protein